MPRLGGFFDVGKRLHDIEDKEQLTFNPDFWNDPMHAQAVLKEIKINKKWVENFKVIQDQMDELEILFEYSKQGDATEEEVEEHYQKCIEVMDDAEFRSTLNQPQDVLGCILEINAGAGGTESCDWSDMLFRMYIMWAEKNDYKIAQLYKVDGDVAGIKSAGLEITGDYAYGLLKGENGVHRLVRISPFNSQGKRMTSFSSVFVHPMIDDTIDIQINPADLDWDTFRSSGAGGQHVNKTESAVRVRHLPSGIVVECQQERSQHQNRDKAIQMLKSRLYEAELERQLEAKDKVESQKMKNEWGSQIRSYVLDDRRVKDHRTGHTDYNTEAVLNGSLNGFLKAYLMWDKKLIGVPEE